jgi:transcriptional regulator with XRE-family HTH domain
MGKAKRMKPERLAEKLLKIRERLGLSQGDMVVRLGYADLFSRNYISAFELETREPPLPVLLAYARLAGISTDVLIDDDLDLPDKLPLSESLPSRKKSEGAKQHK